MGLLSEAGSTKGHLGLGKKKVGKKHHGGKKHHKKR
jgi:hypothetical protein